MNELADELKIDPIELRLRNYAKVDPSNQKPFTSKSLRECYQVGAEKFGWSSRTSEPRSMRDGDEFVGMGMASCAYPAYQAGASASCRLMPDGSISVTSAAHDLGTGTYTILGQIAAETLGVSTDRVRVEIGDTALPRAPGAGGSTQAVSVGSAVRGAASELVKTLRKMASNDANSPLAGKDVDSIIAADGRLQLADDATVGESLTNFAKRIGRPISATADAAVDPSLTNKYSRYSFGAQFIEVRVNPKIGSVRVSRALGIFAAGRILNAKTARSQLMGGIVMGLGMSLWEQTRHDYTTGKIVTDNLADYLVPVNADIPAIEVIFVDEKDELINPLGAKGVGELGITGVPAAVAHAVYHATGKRVRDLPITSDKLIDLT
jgi:xanthine dehydrogenase YagR molybdenum-binding subunit